MNTFVQLIQIITLKRKPSEINYDTSAAIIVTMATIATTYVQIIASKLLSDQQIIFVIAQTIGQAGLIWLLLKARNKENRYIQTITALFGVSAVLNLFGIIILQLPVLIAFGILFSAWNFYLIVLILGEALECSIIRSAFITIAYHITVTMFLYLLLPDLFADIIANISAAKTA